jgi:acetoin utilization deacetylase AcuC-like enzyme
MKVIFHREFYRRYTHDPAAAKGRLEAVINVIKPHVELIDAVPAAPEDLAAVHTEAHIAHVRADGLYDIAALAAGGAIQAATLGLEEPCFGLIRPPGHHASADSSWGFCYFSNMAVALCHLKRRGKIETAHVLDFDMHFGDGTVNILQPLHWITLHNPNASRREEYLEEVDATLAKCEADLIGISAGFDDHVQDWGGTLLTEDYRELGAMVRRTAVRNGGGCFAILEGGYNHDVLGLNALALIEGMSV